MKEVAAKPYLKKKGNQQSLKKKKRNPRLPYDTTSNKTVLHLKTCSTGCQKQAEHLSTMTATTYQTKMEVEVERTVAAFPEKDGEKETKKTMLAYMSCCIE